MSFQSSISGVGSPYSQRKFQHPFDQNATLRRDDEFSRPSRDQESVGVYGHEKSQLQNLIQQLHEREAEVRKWKERALKVEAGFKEVQQILNESDDIRVILEDKLRENEHLTQMIESLRSENIALKQSHGNFMGYQKELEQQIQSLEKQQQQKKPFHPSQNNQDFNELGTKLEQLQKELYNSNQQLENANKAIREKDLQIKRMDLSLIEKENMLRQVKREMELLQKKQNQKEEDLRREYQRQVDASEEKITKEVEEFGNERSLYKQRMQELEQSLSEMQRAYDDLRNKNIATDRDLQAYQKEHQQLLQSNDMLNQSLQEMQQRFNQSHITQRTKYTQELETQRHNYELHINKLSSDLQALEKLVQAYQEQLNQKNGQLEQLVDQIGNLKKENDILQGEIDLGKEKNIELHKQRTLELELQDGHYKENIDQIVSTYNQQAKQLEQQIMILRSNLEKKTKEADELRLQLSEVIMKLNDITDLQKHILMENETLRNTIHQLQKQKEWEDNEKDEQKKKDIGQLKRYHETIYDQIGRENKSIRQILEQKTKECEEWRSECLRLKHYLQ